MAGWDITDFEDDEIYKEVVKRGLVIDDKPSPKSLSFIELWDEARRRHLIKFIYEYSDEEIKTSAVSRNLFPISSFETKNMKEELESRNEWPTLGSFDDKNIEEEARGRGLINESLDDYSDYEIEAEAEHRGIFNISDDELLSMIEERNIETKVLIDLVNSEMETHYRNKNLKEFLIALGRALPQFKDADLMLKE